MMIKFKVRGGSIFFWLESTTMILFALNGPHLFPTVELLVPFPYLLIHSVLRRSQVFPKLNALEQPTMFMCLLMLQQIQTNTS